MMWFFLLEHPGFPFNDIYIFNTVSFGVHAGLKEVKKTSHSLTDL